MASLLGCMYVFLWFIVWRIFHPIFSGNDSGLFTHGRKQLFSFLVLSNGLVRSTTLRHIGRATEHYDYRVRFPAKQYTSTVLPPGGYC